MVQKLRVPLGFVIAAAVLYFAKPTALSIFVGLPVALIGAVFRALAAGVIKKDSTLATGGVYALTRNPLYFGSSLLAAGFAVMSGSALAAGLILAPFVLIYPAVIFREEAHLQRLFPKQFELYKSTVPRFFPRISFSFPASFAFSQYLANREYNTALGFAGAVGILVIKRWLA
jgi:protein-S-isoprenylcysteine O-methyltransferase Ste14